ncbi:MAG: MFS transporter [Candidatus Thorarchaeota archaeon]
MKLDTMLSEPPNEEPTESLRPFAILWSGQAISLFGSRLVRFTIVWYLTLQTGSATVLAIATIMALLPQVLIAPFAGSYVDRWNRRRTMIAADMIIALSILFLVAMFHFGTIEVWHIYLAMLIGSAAGAFHWPAMLASTSLMVPKKHLLRVGGLNHTLQGAAGIIAPPLGALVLILLPMSTILMIDVVTAIIAIGALAAVHVPQPERTSLAMEKSVLGDMMDGFRFLRKTRGILLIVVMAMFLNLVGGPAGALIPILVTNHFHGDVTHLAIIQSASAIGMVLSGILLGIWGGGKKRTFTALIALIMIGILDTLIGLMPPDAFFQATALFFLVAGLGTIVNGSILALLQSTIPADKQGRVFALVVSGSTAMMPIGLVIAGPVADVYGVPIWFIASGVATIVLGTAALLTPSVRALDDVMETAAAESPEEPVEGLVPNSEDEEGMPSQAHDELNETE